MHGDTPGQTGAIRCPHCGNTVFFPFRGGPQQLPCSKCRETVSVEVVFDGRRWRTKVIRNRNR